MSTDQETEEVQSLNFLLDLKKRYPKLEKHLFRLLDSLYPRLSLHDHENRLQNLLFCFKPFLLIFQLSSIIWVENVGIQHWSYYNHIWIILENGRFDVICAELDLSSDCSILAFSLFLAIFIFFLSLFLLSLLRKRFYPRLNSLLRNLLALVDFWDLSLAVFLLLSLRISWQHWVPSNFPAEAKMDLSSLGVIASIAACLGLALVGYANKAFSYDTRHSRARLSYKNRAQSVPDLVGLAINYKTAILFVFASDNNFAVYLVLVLILQCIPLYYYVFYLPYYKYWINFLKCLPHLFSVVSSLVILFGYIVNSADFAVFGLFLLNPILALILFTTINYRISLLKQRKTKELKNLWVFELLIRDNLLNHRDEQGHENNARFVEFCMATPGPKPMKAVLWKSTYCFELCKREQLSMIKLNRDELSPGNLEERFQEYIIRKEVYEVIHDKYKEYRLITKFLKFEKVKALDKCTCLRILQFLASIKTENIKLDKLEEVGAHVIEDIRLTMKMYKKVTSEFADSTMILSIYSTFTLNIIEDREKSNRINLKIENILKGMKYKGTKFVSLFHEENPLVMASGRNKEIGKIEYANQGFYSMISGGILSIVNSFIPSLFPVEFDFFSPKKLQEFKFGLYETTTYLEENLVIKDTKGFIKETKLIVIAMALTKPLFLFVFKPSGLIREVALISQNGQIIEYSLHFAELLKFTHEIKGFYISNLIDINFKNLKRNKRVQIVIQGVELLISYNKQVVLKTKLRFLYLYNMQSIASKELLDELEGNDNTMADKKVTFINYDEKSNFADSRQLKLIDNIASKKSDTDLSSSSSMIRKIKHHTNQALKGIATFRKVLLVSVINK
jgi:hypothetical protein